MKRLGAESKNDAGEKGRYDSINDQTWLTEHVEDLERDPGSVFTKVLNRRYTQAQVMTTREKDGDGEDIPGTQAGASTLTLNEWTLKLWNERRNANKHFMLSQPAIDNVFKKKGSFF